MTPPENHEQDPAQAEAPAPSLRDQIEQAISAHEVILFMKGTPEAPACGFSARTAAILKATGTPFAAIDVLTDPRIRQELSALSNWPTIPQLFVRGELVGGCDIVTEMHESGELSELLGSSGEAAPATPGAESAGEAAGVAAPGPGFTSVENRLA
jgi:monothiol glutaredoxin